MSQRNPRTNMKVIARTATELGFDVVRTAGGHRCAIHPSGGAKIYFSATSVSPRGAKNAIAALRRTVRQLNAQGDVA